MAAASGGSRTRAPGAAGERGAASVMRPRDRPPRRVRLRATLLQGAMLAGAFAGYRRIDLASVERLVFVCTGNICRSPFAEGLAARLGVPSSSLGLDASTGARSPHTAVEVAHRHGIDLTTHRACALADFRFLPGDLVIGFERKHVARLRHVPRRTAGVQLTLAGLWLARRRIEILDPYGLSDRAYESCYRAVEETVTALARRLLAARVTTP